MGKLYPVEQRHRDAAAAWAKSNSRHQQAANIRRGSCDTAPLVQSFARFEAEHLSRIEATPAVDREAARETIARKLCELAGHDPDGGPKSGFGWTNYLRDADAIMALPPVKQSDGWKDISTAPKDGTWFLAFENDEIYPCQWLTDEPDEGPPCQGWRDLFNESFEAPTHWRPLPAPPAIRSLDITRMGGSD